MLPKSLQNLIDHFAKLPGVGKKTAQRFAYHLLRSQRSLAKELGQSLLSLGDTVQLCTECFIVTDSVICETCSNPRREQNIICVVEHIFDAEAIEHCGEYKGLYHILHGRISPLDQIGPEDLKINALIRRIEKRKKESTAAIEIILATNPNSEGEITALYLQKILQPLGVRVTRIATGIPMGADLEYADEVTLGRAMKGRQNYE